MAMSGILAAMDESLPGSAIYVFTDASAKDVDVAPKVFDRIKKKKLQVIVTGVMTLIYRLSK